MNIKYILFILILILSIISILYYFNKSNKISKLEHFEDNKLDFSNIKNIKKTHIEPYNDFVNIDNPVNSSVVLSQSSLPDGVSDSKELRDSYYKISTPLEAGKNYKLSGWVATTSDWNGKDNLFNVRLTNSEKRHNALSDPGNVLKELAINGLTWKYVIYPFSVPDSVDDIIDIFIGYKPNNTTGKRFITGLQLDKSIIGDDEFPNNDKLVLYLNAENVNNFTYKKFWNDISGNNFNFLFEKDPIHKNNYFLMSDRKLVGPSPIKIGLNNNNFTLCFMSCSEGGDITGEAILLPGNEEVAMGITIPNSYGKLVCEIADKKYPIDQKIITENNTFYTFVYKEGEVNIYVNDKKITTLKTNKIYFNNNSIVINPQRNWNAKLYGMCIFNKSLEENDVKYLNSYFQKKIMNDIVDNYQKKEVVENFDNNNTFLKEQNKLNSDCPMIYKENDKFLVNIDKKSKYASENGMYGELNLGRDFNNVTNVYKNHFPNCEVEGLEELDNNFLDVTGKKPLFSSSYVKNKLLHPNLACAELHNLKDGDKLNLSKKCKNSIRAHCENQVLHNINSLHKVDDICKSFHPMMSNNPDSQEQLLSLHSDLLKPTITK